jgi:hypothetical protein
VSFLSRPRRSRHRPHLNTLDAGKVPAVRKKFQKVRLMPNQYRVSTEHVASEGLAAKTARLRPESRLSCRRRLDWTLTGATSSGDTGHNGAWSQPARRRYLGVGGHTTVAECQGLRPVNIFDSAQTFWRAVGSARFEETFSNSMGSKRMPVVLRRTIFRSERQSRGSIPRRRRQCVVELPLVEVYGQSVAAASKS